MKWHVRIIQDATGNAADIAVGWAIGCGAPFAFGLFPAQACI
jgi:ketol-acid reductoisomerase